MKVKLNVTRNLLQSDSQQTQNTIGACPVVRGGHLVPLNNQDYLYWGVFVCKIGIWYIFEFVWSGQEKNPETFGFIIRQIFIFSKICVC